MAKKNKQYNVTEKRAYWVGVGMAIGLSGGISDFSNKTDSKVKKSLDKGFAREMGRNPVSTKLTRKTRIN